MFNIKFNAHHQVRSKSKRWKTK